MVGNLSYTERFFDDGVLREQYRLESDTTSMPAIILCTYQPRESLQRSQFNDALWMRHDCFQLFPQSDLDILVREHVIDCNPHCPGCRIAASQQDFEAFVCHTLGPFLLFWKAAG